MLLLSESGVLAAPVDSGRRSHALQLQAQGSFDKDGDDLHSPEFATDDEASLMPEC